ncbi:MAG: aminoacyl-tRNA hydrolase [Treponema sp.]|jgi:PTH1 family peptidyl-tRNA hydrolase|nr:aminoacyl-tRNA hydrolase [Treponema sp.]
MIQLIAFLGNPGREYARNRHNAGRLLAAELPFYSSLDWKKKYKGLYAALDRSRLIAAAPDSEKFLPAPPLPPTPAAQPPSAGELPAKFHFLIPETYMNLSGESVFAAASFFRIKPEEILVVHDELEIALGVLSLKFSGGLGGHNGLRSMKACFGTADFWRLRIGLGRPDDRRPGEGGAAGSGRDIAGWVLSDFTRAEEETLAPVFAAGAALLVRALTGGPEKLLPEWGKKVCRPAPKSG